MRMSGYPSDILWDDGALAEQARTSAFENSKDWRIYILDHAAIISLPISIADIMWKSFPSGFRIYLTLTIYTVTIYGFCRREMTAVKTIIVNE